MQRDSKVRAAQNHRLMTDVLSPPTPPVRSFLVVSAVSFQKLPLGYSLLINPSSLFNVRQETGEISLTRSLDYESDQRRYLLMVRASEEPGSLSTVTEVRTHGRTRAGSEFQPSVKMRSPPRRVTRAFIPNLPFA